MIECATKEINIFPVWLCPARFVKYDDHEYKTYAHWGKDDVIVDIGFYG